MTRKRTEARMAEMMTTMPQLRTWTLRKILASTSKKVSAPFPNHRNACSQFVVNTGEEEERTILTCTAKLYHFEKEWKESGVGDFKINVRYERASNSNPRANDDAKKSKGEAEEVVPGDDEEDLESGPFKGLERRGRLIMRARGTHRLVLNTPVFKEMKVGTVDGEEPTGKTMHLTALQDGKPTGYQIKVSRRILRLVHACLVAEY
jgi:hypothetical protein